MKPGGPKNDIWPTPDWVFRPLNQLLRFDLDAAANHQNARCRKYYTERENGLLQPWLGRSVWCNPPYGEATGDWVKHGRDECKRLQNRVTMLLPIKADTAWWHRQVWGRNKVVDSALIHGRLAGRWYQLEEQGFHVELLELLGRVSFGGDGPGWFASAIVVFNSGASPILPRVRP